MTSVRSRGLTIHARREVENAAVAAKRVLSGVALSHPLAAPLERGSDRQLRATATAAALNGAVLSPSGNEGLPCHASETPRRPASGAPLTPWGFAAGRRSDGGSGGERSSGERQGDRRRGDRRPGDRRRRRGDVHRRGALARRRPRHREGAEHRRPERGGRGRDREGLRGGGDRPRERARVLPRDDRLRQRAAGGRRRADRARDDGGVPGRAGDRPADPALAVRPRRREAGAARPPPPSVRSGRADEPRRGRATRR